MHKQINLPACSCARALALAWVAENAALGPCGRKDTHGDAHKHTENTNTRRPRNKFLSHTQLKTSKCGNKRKRRDGDDGGDDTEPAEQSRRQCGWSGYPGGCGTVTQQRWGGYGTMTQQRWGAAAHSRSRGGGSATQSRVGGLRHSHAAEMGGCGAITQHRWGAAAHSRSRGGGCSTVMQQSGQSAYTDNGEERRRRKR